MKKYLSVLILLLFVQLSLKSQKFGVRGGIQFADFKSAQIMGNESITGWHLGPVFEIGIPGSLNLQIGVIYTRKGSRDGFSANKFDLEYLELPLTVRYGFGPLFLQGGGFASYLMNASFGTLDLKESLENSDFGLHAGAGVSVGGFRLDGRYVFGLYNINALNNDSIKNKAVVIGVEYMF